DLASDHCQNNLCITDFFGTDTEDVLRENSEIGFFADLQRPDTVFRKSRVGRPARICVDGLLDCEPLRRRNKTRSSRRIRRREELTKRARDTLLNSAKRI